MMMMITGIDALRLTKAAVVTFEMERTFRVFQPFKRRAGNMSSMSGGDNTVYMEYRRSARRNQHPLFRRFRR